MDEPTPPAERAEPWTVWVDTGGTFTDCLAIDPAGRLHRAKVPSSATLRARVASNHGRLLRWDAGWTVPAGFLNGATCGPTAAGDDAARRVRVVSHPEPGEVRLDRALQVERGTPVTFGFDCEAPLLAARLVTGTRAGFPLPPLDLRLATTRGTNALLERRTARVALFVTEGFADLLSIGDQRRPDLFALDIRRPPPLWEAVVEVLGRRDALGAVVRPFDPELVLRAGERLLAAGIDGAAVALMHAWRVPEIEAEVADLLLGLGFRHVSRSADLSPVLGLEQRARTAVVDAALAPIVGDYLERVGSEVEGRFRVMTSAGGLVDAQGYKARDSLLSGPAGGVVGAAWSGAAAGEARLIAFDMGGTSTDVSRWGGDFEYRFSTRVGDVTIAAPALAIETVAAGGGSVCGLDEGELTVGPESAGASPGPACYGAGGPLTLTDVDLLLGRLVPGRFGLPLDPAAAEVRLDELVSALRERGRPLDREGVLSGFLRIADERMAETVRRVSVRWGHDPQEHTLVAFGGAGGQHACAVAALLGMGRVLLPPEAGLLSALGLGVARLERFAEEQVLVRLRDEQADLLGRLARLEARASGDLERDGVARGQAVIRRRMAFVRLEGQETTLEVEVDPADPERLERDFEAAYRARYGYRPADRCVELESLRVVASSDSALPPALGRGFEESPPGVAGRPADSDSDQHREAWFDGWRGVEIVERDRIGEAARPGPLLVLDPHSLLVVPPDWTVRGVASGALLGERSISLSASSRLLQRASPRPAG